MSIRLLLPILALVAIAWATPASAAPTVLTDSDLDSIVAGHDWKDRHVDRKKDVHDRKDFKKDRHFADKRDSHKKDVHKKDFDRSDADTRLGHKKDRKHRHFAGKKHDGKRKHFAHKDRKHHLVKKKILVIKKVRVL